MAENEKTIKEALVDDATFANDLMSFFDNFLKTGVIVKEKLIVPGFQVKLKVLNTEELLLAETILAATNPNIPMDVIQKVRAASILAQAIITINGLEVEKEDMAPGENSKRRDNLYRHILKMPALVIQKTYEFYIEAVKEQNALYENHAETGKKIENF